MHQFMKSGYAIAIASMAGFALLAIALSLFAAVRKTQDGAVSGSSPAPDHSSLAHRVRRTNLDATEMMGIFVASTMAAILAEAPPYWVNMLAFIFLISRVVHAIVQIGSVGPAHYALRLSIAGWFACTVQALIAVVSAFSKA